MQKWEYFRLVAYLDKKEWKLWYKGVAHSLQDIDGVLADLGVDGWEMVGIASTIDSEYHHRGMLDDKEGMLVHTITTSYYFKRPKA